MEHWQLRKTTDDDVQGMVTWLFALSLVTFYHIDNLMVKCQPNSDLNTGTVFFVTVPPAEVAGINSGQDIRAQLDARQFPVKDLFKIQVETTSFQTWAVAMGKELVLSGSSGSNPRVQQQSFHDSNSRPESMRLMCWNASLVQNQSDEYFDILRRI
jgi:hypothetical protein